MHSGAHASGGAGDQTKMILDYPGLVALTLPLNWTSDARRAAALGMNTKTLHRLRHGAPIGGDVMSKIVLTLQRHGVEVSMDALFRAVEIDPESARTAS